MHMRDDPDDLRGLLIHASDQEPLADGIHARRICRPKTASQGFVYDGDALRIRRVPLVKSLPRRNGISSVRKYPGVVVQMVAIRRWFSGSGGFAASCTGVPA